MESKDDDFVEMVAEVVMRREAAQRAIERVVERVGRFNGDKVPFYLEAYNAVSCLSASDRCVSRVGTTGVLD